MTEGKRSRGGSMSHPRRMRSLAKCQIKKIKRLFFSYNKEILLLSYRNSAHKGKNKPKMKRELAHIYMILILIYYTVYCQDKRKSRVMYHMWIQFYAKKKRLYVVNESCINCVMVNKKKERGVEHEQKLSSLMRWKLT